MQRELREVLRDERDHAGVVRARRDLAEPDVVALDEEFDAEDARPAERAGDGFGDALRPLQRAGAVIGWGCHDSR